MKVPRSGADALSQAADIAPNTAKTWLRRLPESEAFDEMDANLRIAAVTADLEAARSLTEDDARAAASSTDPRSAISDVLAVRAERRLIAQIAVHTSWARTPDPAARTAPARAALAAKFLAEAGGDPVRAEHLRKAHYKRLALKSAQSRRAKGTTK